MGDFGVGGATHGQGSGKSAATEAIVTIGATGGAIEADGGGCIACADEVELSTTEVFSVEWGGKESEFNGVEAACCTVGVGGASDEFGGVDVSAQVTDVVGVAATGCFDRDVGDFAGRLDVDLGEAAVVCAATVAISVVVACGSVAASVVVNDGDLNFLSESILDDHDKAVGSGVVGILAGLSEQGAVGSVVCVEGDTKDPEGSACVHERGKDAASVAGVESAAKGSFSAVDGGSGVGNTGGAGSREVVGHAREQLGIDLERELRGIFAVSDSDFNGDSGGGGLCGDA